MGAHSIARSSIASWSTEFDTDGLDVVRFCRVMREYRYVFRDAYDIVQNADMRSYVEGTFTLACIAISDTQVSKRWTTHVEATARANGLVHLPLWLAVLVAANMKQEKLPSDYCVLMHDPVSVALKDNKGVRERVLALAKGERELLVTAPRIHSTAPWEENRTFMYLSPR